jgi:trehalose 2-sulfotransferase
MHSPKQSYIIWFSQRTGSTLLAAALEATRLCGAPYEHLNEQDPKVFTLTDLHAVWQAGTGVVSGAGGIFGLKYGPSRNMADWTEAFRRVLELPQTASAPDIWAAAFPNCSHIFMTRRNRVLLAVSWWRAIVSGEWHREHGAAPQIADLAGRYDFGAIDHLFAESSLREATTEDFFAAANVVPLTVVYEDFIRDYEGTLRGVLAHLDLGAGAVIGPPRFEKMADVLSAEWAQRYKQEKQVGWSNPAW